MKTVPAGEFKAKCLRLMEEVSQTGEPLLVTKRGKPLVKVGPGDDAAERHRRNLEIEDRILKELGSQLVILGDIEEPAWGEEEWADLEAEWDELYK
ncbi:MAG TPA: type II toxin-antitoxin system Phd/YefM family antitoxin [Dehalococcoidia bacterium]|nr:type II toxin-antitoxin system Phd/YefM family antitoxin [Dehalococcoidia bacterium]